MKNVLQKLYNLGIDQEQVLSQIDRQRNINLICWVTIFCCLIILLVNIPTGENVRIFSLIGVIISFFIPPFFNFFKKTEIAKYSLLIISYVVIFMYGFLYGEVIGIENFFLVTPVGALLLSEQKRLHYFLLITSALAFIILKVSFLHFTPWMSIPPKLNIPLIIGLTILFLGFILAHRFKTLMTLAHDKKDEALEQLKINNLKLLKKEQELETINQELQHEAMLRYGAMRALSESEERYQMLFEHGFEGIMIGDLNSGKPVSCNEKLLDFLGMDKDAFLKTNMMTLLITPEDKRTQTIAKTKEQVEQFKINGKIQFKTALNSPKKGKVVAEVTAVLLPSPNEHLAIAIIKDITQQIKVQEKILAANEGLKNFAHAASHDLKEPLRMIQSFGQLLERRNRDNLDKNSQEFLGYIIDASSRMNQLIQDLLEYSTTGMDENPSKIMDLNSILLLVQNNLRLKIIETKTIITSKKLPIIQAHPTMMSQLLQNIIANAIKFQSSGNQPQIEISVIQYAEYLDIELKDNGIGIAPEYHEQIFGVFKRLHSKSDYAGSGIGLATCRKIMEGYGGKIWVKSALGQGTSFFVRFPKNIVVSYEPKEEDSMEETIKDKFLIST